MDNEEIAGALVEPTLFEPAEGSASMDEDDVRGGALPLSFDDVRQSLEADMKRRLEEYRQRIKQPEYVESLKSVVAEYLSPTSFSPGDLISWKRSLKASWYPDYGAPAVFIRYLNEQDPLPENPMIDQDCVIGWLDEDLDFVVGRGNSRRFTLWQSV